MQEFKNKYLKKLWVGGTELPSNVLMAPLAGYTNFPFRVMCRQLGAGLAFTEMVSVNGLKYNDAATKKLLFTSPLETIKAVQLLGSEPNIFEHTCRSEHIAPFDIIDINMGCPVPNIIKNGEGCALMNDLPRASRIIQACRRSGKTVTVKCRVGMTERSINIVEFAKMCEDSGADMISIHARTRNMMYDGEPLYEHIAEAKGAVNIPVIANGGIFTEADALRFMEKTGVDGVMPARGGFEDPLLFARLTGTETAASKLELIRSQIGLTSACFDELYTLTYIKKLASYFMKKMRGTKQYKHELYRCGNTDELYNITEKIFSERGEKIE